MNDWLIDTAEWITSPTVMSILLFIGILGLVIELLAPGNFILGIIGFTAFVIYFTGHSIAGTSNDFAPYLFAVGIILIILELLVPSLGILGIIGTVVLFYSVVAVAESVKAGLMALGIGILGTVLFLWILYRFFGFRTSWRRIILKDAQHNRDGFTSSRKRNHLLGKIGNTITPLRPSGWVLIDGRKEDVVSEGEMIPANRRVKVIHVEGSRVVVREVMEIESEVEES